MCNHVIHRGEIRIVGTWEAFEAGSAFVFVLENAGTHESRGTIAGTLQVGKSTFTRSVEDVSIQGLCDAVHAEVFLFVVHYLPGRTKAGAAEKATTNGADKPDITAVFVDKESAGSATNIVRTHILPSQVFVQTKPAHAVSLAHCIGHPLRV